MAFSYIALGRACPLSDVAQWKIWWGELVFWRRGSSLARGYIKIGEQSGFESVVVGWLCLVDIESMIA